LVYWHWELLSQGQRGDVVTGKNMARFLRVSIGAGAAISGFMDRVQEKRQ